MREVQQLRGKMALMKQMKKVKIFGILSGD
jgi:hypothetical protein